MTTARAVALSINGDKFTENVNDAIGTGTSGLDLKDRIKRVLADSNVYLAYAVHPGGKEVIRLFASDTLPLHLEAESYPYSDALTYSFATGKEPFFSNEGVSPALYNKANKSVSAFAPIRSSSGDVVGAVGIYADAGRYLASAARFRNTLLWITVPSAILFGAGVVRLLKRRVAEPLRLISTAAADLANGTVSSARSLPGGRDELGVLSSSLNAASSSIGSLIDGVAAFSSGHAPETEGDIVPASSMPEGYRAIANSINKTIALLDNVNQMIYAADLETGRILYVNKKMAAAFDLNVRDILGNKCWEVFGNRMTRCPGCRVSGSGAEEREGDGTGNLTREWFEPRLGKWISSVSTVIPWIDGRLAHFFYGSDITVCKQLSDQREQHERQLREAADAAREASRKKTAFIVNMSHEIRIPMNGIIGFAELAASEKDLSAKTREYLRKIKTSAEELLGLMNDFQDISKIETGMIEQEKKPFSLREVLESCRDISSPAAKQKGLSLYFYAEPYVGKQLVGDPDKLRQILLNLLSNAVKFTNRGIIKLSAVVEKSYADSATIRFEVKDSGIGMTPDQVRTVIKPFEKAVVGDARRHGGAGLGLAIANRLAACLGGTLKVESARGLGSKFYFSVTFDTVDAPEGTRPIRDSSGRMPRFEGRVLICEDNFINQEVLLEHLSKVGLMVDVAANGQVGVEMAEAARHDGRPYDLILMDVRMPVMDGLEATERLRALENPSPIIGVTANIMQKDHEMYFKIGMVDCLAKPFLAQDLWALLRRYLTELDTGDLYDLTAPVQILPTRKPENGGGGNGQASSTGNGETHVIDKPLGLQRAAGDARRYQKNLRAFVKTHRDAAKELKDLLRTGDTDRVRAIAHGMRGAAGMIGATALSEAAKRLEEALTESARLTNEDDVHAFEIALNAVLGEISRTGGEGDEAKPAGNARRDR